MISQERRLTVSQLQLRAAPKGSNSPGRLAGYAAKFGTLSQDLGGFRETIQPGAFSRSLREGADVRALVNHDPNNILGRTKSGTMRISEDKVGLCFVCDLPNTQLGKDIHESIKRGDISQMSFAFKVAEGGDAWTDDVDENGQKFVKRTLKDVDLFDCSVVTYPAYLDTNVDSINPAQLDSIRVAKQVLLEARARGARIVTVQKAAIKKDDDSTLRMRAELQGRYIKLHEQIIDKRIRERNVARNHGRRPVRNF